MDELIRQALNQLRGMWRRRWVGLGVAWAIALIGGAVVLRMPDRYEASARVFVDTQSILRPLMSGLAIQPDIDQQVAILSRTLISRPNVEKLIHMTNLDANVTSAKEREALIERLIGTLFIKRAERENVYTIAYRDESRTEARRVVQALLSIFVESSVGDQRRGSDTARRFIEEQISAYEKKLAEAENRLKEFKLKYMGILGTDGKDYFTQMTTLGEELTKARMELRASEESRDALKRELAAEDPIMVTPDVPTGPAPAVPVSDIDARIAALRRTLDELLRRFTEEHPDVIGTRRVIEQLEEQKREELQANKKAAAEAKKAPTTPTATPTSTNPVYQQIKVSLAEAEANVAALRAKVDELDARHRQLQASARQRPQVDAELAQLNRDYDVQKRNYESLVSRRESASMSNELDATAGVGDFRIIDPPNVSPRAVAPNRLLLLALVLVAGLGAGVFTSLIVSQIFPTFHDARALREFAQRPVLGTVTLLSSPQVRARRRRSAVLFAGGVASLCGLLGTAMLAVTLPL